MPGACIAKVRNHLRDQLDEGERAIDIGNIHWLPRPSSSDLALVELEYAVQLDERARVIKLSETRLKPVDEVTTLGWGIASHQVQDTTNSPRRAQLVVTAISEETTDTKVGRHPFTGSPIDPCKGDSGGPLFAERDDEWILFATLHGGGYSCKDDIIRGDAVWNAIAPQFEWIRSIMDDLEELAGGDKIKLLPNFNVGCCSSRQEKRKYNCQFLFFLQLIKFSKHVRCAGVFSVPFMWRTGPYEPRLLQAPRVLASSPATGPTSPIQVMLGHTS